MSRKGGAHVMSSDSNTWDRRKFLGMGAGALSVGLAGCGGTSSTTTTTNGGGGGGGSDETQLDFVGGRNPTTIQFNPWNLANFGHTYVTYFTTPVAQAHSTGEITSFFLESLETDGKELTMRFPTGWKWWNGRDLTAKDYYTALEINRLQDPKASNVESNTLVDDRTIRRTFKKQVTPTLMKASLLNPPFATVSTPRWVYSDYLSRYKNASSQEERNAITQDLLKMTIPVKQVIEEGLGNGLYEITEFSSAETITKKFEDHPLAGETDVPSTRVIPVGQQTNQLATNDKLDFTPFGYITEPDRYPDNIQNQFKLEWFRTQKYILNWKNEHLAKRPVRRAIISAIDIEAIAQAAIRANYIGDATQVQTGLRSSLHDRFLSEGFVDKLIKYPVGGDTDTATQYMEQAGYSKSGGTWTGPNGKEVTLDILTRDNIGQAQPTKFLSDQLNAFGIKTNMNAVGQNYYSKLQEWSFDIAWVWHVARALWHPVSYFSNNFYGVLAGDPSSDAETGPTGVPFTTKIPSTVGAKEVSGEGKEIHPAQLMNDLPTSTSLEQVVDRTETLVQWFNYDLPDIVYLQENSGYWGDQANFSFPNPDEKNIDVNNPGQYAWQRGWIGLE